MAREDFLPDTAWEYGGAEVLMRYKLGQLVLIIGSKGSEDR